MIDIFHEGVIKGQAEVQVLARIRSAASVVIHKYAPVASDEALLALGAVFVDELEAIGTIDKLACYAFLFPQNGQTIHIMNYVTSELRERDLEATDLIIRTGESGRARALSQERLVGLYEKVFAIIRRNYDSAIVDGLLLMGTNGSAVSRELVCEITFVIYKEILLLPPQEAADLLRDTFS